MSCSPKEVGEDIWNVSRLPGHGMVCSGIFSFGVLVSLKASTTSIWHPCVGLPRGSGFAVAESLCPEEAVRITFPKPGPPFILQEGWNSGEIASKSVPSLREECSPLFKNTSPTSEADTVIELLGFHPVTLQMPTADLLCTQLGWVLLMPRKMKSQNLYPPGQQFSNFLV